MVYCLTNASFKSILKIIYYRYKKMLILQNIFQYSQEKFSGWPSYMHTYYWHFQQYNFGTRGVVLHSSTNEWPLNTSQHLSLLRELFQTVRTFPVQYVQSIYTITSPSQRSNAVMFVLTDFSAWTFLAWTVFVDANFQVLVTKQSAM